MPDSTTHSVSEGSKWVWMLVVLVGSLTASAQRGVTPASFHMEEMLFYPTMEGVTLGLIPAEEVFLVVGYGRPGAPERRTATRRVAAGKLAVFRLERLRPDREYVYRVHVRRLHEAAFSPREEHRFRTLRSPGSTFSFAVIGDPHAWAMWADVECSIDVPGPGGSSGGGQTLSTTLESVRADPGLDFLVVGTDSVMTKCGACKPCFVDGEFVAEGSSPSQADARLRYRKVFSPDVYGMVGADLPLLYMLGDHDGERGWAGQGCGYSVEQYEWSAAARRAHVPRPPRVYASDSGGTAYRLQSGDVLLVVIDVMRYTERAPTGPELWSLGHAQLEWLDNVLGDSDATFKIVVAEHLLGGVNEPGVACWKARGGLRSTHNGEVNGTFLGEQAIVHEMLKQHGAQVFLSFQDHVVVWGEKVDADFVGEGVTYVIGGRCSDVGHPWTEQAWYRAAMDYDGDGIPEYLTDTTGTRKKGWFKVTVHGQERVEFEYLRSDASATLNGTKVLGFTIRP